MKKEDWQKVWCSHCRCKVGVHNSKIKYDVVLKDRKTSEERVIDSVCELCVWNLGYIENNYTDE